jgi:CheY-like chemotaxis protein
MEGLRIWVVEDNDTNWELVEFLLTEAGDAVTRAANGEELRELATGAPPDLILMDMNLPGASGLELVTELRADARFGAVPIVALTAHAMRGDRERFLAAGCSGYIAKPIETGSFAAQVRAFAGAERG